jgi:glycosyltransferase involved in cell wall biosynthesis
MRTLIIAAGRFGSAMRADIAAGREPRLDVFELSKALDADVVDYLDVDRSRRPDVRALAKTLGDSPALAYVASLESRRYDALLTSGEDIGIPLAALLMASRAKCSHTMIAHTLTPAKKTFFFRHLKVANGIDRILAYATSEERHMLDVLRIPAAKVQRIFFHADQRFFTPSEAPTEPRLVCGAGQLLRDYDTLIDAVDGLGIRLEIAAGSPWIAKALSPRRSLPTYVKWDRLGRPALRDMYARAALAVVPIFENDYQTGIATILEMMSMGKCIVASRTRGQTDTIRDGETGVYVPPGDVGAMRRAIERLLANPDEAARIGRNARRFIEEEASLDHFVARVADAVRAGHAHHASVTSRA